jgi:hypothetical protein
MERIKRSGVDNETVCFGISPLKVVVSLELMPRWPGISGWNGSDSDLRGSRMISELLIRDVRRS